MQSQVNNQIVAPVTSLRDQVNSDTIPQLVSLKDQVNGIASNVANAISEINQIFTTENGNIGNLETYLVATNYNISGTAFTAATPGLLAGYLTALVYVSTEPGSAAITPANLSQGFPDISVPIAEVTQSFATVTQGLSDLSHGAGVPWSPINNVTQTNISWIPVGHSTPVPVTPAEGAAIMTGIAARTNSLQAAKVSKQAEVNALTTIAAVIAYDVLAGWPAT
jgi:hypothetical protein